ncbi:MAG: serine hydrolase [Patescibacteria group bacterium]
MKKNKTKNVYYVHGFKASSTKRRLGAPSLLTGIMIISFLAYGVWANILPNPAVAFRTGTDKIATNILNQNNVENQKSNIDGTAPAKNPQKIKRKNKELNRELAIKTREYRDVAWSIYVEDVDSGLTASLDEGDDYHMGSVSRLVTLPALESKVNPDRWGNYLFGKSVKDCVNSGLGAGNDACYDKLTKYLSKDYINKTTKAYGYDIEVDQNFNAKTSPDKLGTYLSDLKRGQSLFAKTRRAVFDTLYSPKQTAGLSLGCGDCRVANKQSYDNNTAIDAGIVTHGSRSYAVVIVAKGGTFDQITDIAQTIDHYMQP